MTSTITGDPTTSALSVTVSHAYVASHAGRHVALTADSLKAAVKAARRRFGDSFELFRETPVGYERVRP